MCIECNIDWIFDKDLDYKFISLKNQMNRSLWILWLLSARAGSELNLKVMGFIQMIHFKVRVDFYVLIAYCRRHKIDLCLRRDSFWVVKNQTLKNLTTTMTQFPIPITLIFSFSNHSKEISFYWILFRNGHFWRLERKSIFKRKSRFRISN